MADNIKGIDNVYKFLMTVENFVLLNYSLCKI